MRETRVRPLGGEDPLEKKIATHSSTLAWKIPWMEEPGRLQSVRSQRVRHDWATSLSHSKELKLPANNKHKIISKATEQSWKHIVQSQTFSWLQLSLIFELQFHERLWTKTTYLSHFQFPDQWEPCEIINVDCYLKLLGFRIICYAALDSYYILGYPEMECYQNKT